VTKPIPVSAGERIAKSFGYDQVVIVARKVDSNEHVTTYGVDRPNCEVAARMGNFFKHKLMGWPGPAAQPEQRVARLLGAVEGTCAGLALTRGQALAILNCLDGDDPA
jgi:hypothetical protein